VATAKERLRPFDAAKSRSVVVRATWPKPPSARFDIVGVRLGTRLAYGGKLKPGKLKITKSRTSVSVAARVTKLKPGTLKFGVKAAKLSAPTAAKVSVTRR
jgi:hypothetical protein